jgi:hypothetical protein
VDDSNVLSLFGTTKVSGSNPIVSMCKFLVVFSVTRLDSGVLPTTTCQSIFKKPTRGVSHRGLAIYIKKYIKKKEK